MKRAVFSLRSPSTQATLKLWLFQRDFLQSDRLPSEEERWELKFFWISTSQSAAHGSISKSSLFPSVGQCHFSKPQLGRKVKQTRDFFVSYSALLKLCHSSLCSKDKNIQSSFEGPNCSELTI